MKTRWLNLPQSTIRINDNQKTGEVKCPITGQIFHLNGYEVTPKTGAELPPAENIDI